MDRPARVFPAVFATKAESSPSCSALSITTAQAGQPAATEIQQQAETVGPPAHPAARLVVAPFTTAAALWPRRIVRSTQIRSPPVKAATAGRGAPAGSGGRGGAAGGGGGGGGGGAVSTPKRR